MKIARGNSIISLKKFRWTVFLELEFPPSPYKVVVCISSFRNFNPEPDYGAIRVNFMWKLLEKI